MTAAMKQTALVTAIAVLAVIWVGPRLGVTIGRG
jgi:hypothetical protein